MTIDQILIGIAKLADAPKDCALRVTDEALARNGWSEPQFYFEIIERSPYPVEFSRETQAYAIRLYRGEGR